MNNEVLLGVSSIVCGLLYSILNSNELDGLKWLELS